MSLSSRRTWLFLAAVAGAPAAAQSPIDYGLPPSPDPPLRTEIRLGCPGASSEDEIVVCGPREEDERFRVPPSERRPGPADRAGGEQMAALAEGPGRCSPIGPHVQCAGGVDVLAIVFGIARAIARARANRD